MNKKVPFLGTIMLAMALALSACGTGLFKPKVALFLARGGLGDKSFNDSANAGLQKAASELGAETKTYDYQNSEEAQLALMRQVAQRSYDPIIAIGAENTKILNTVATEYPRLNFVMIDNLGQGTNVTSIVFNEMDGDFLAGSLAALLSEKGKVGFLGGANVTVIRRIESGFIQGVQYVNPQAEVDTQFVGGKDDFSGFAKPDLAKQITIQMYANGDEIVYAAAGGSGLGAINAAKAAGKPIITTGSDQRWIAPNVVVTSRTKNMDTAVFDIIQQFMQGKLQTGTVTLDFKSGGIGMAPISDQLVSATIMARYEKIRADLEAGKITIQPYTDQ